ncbi:FG-GAP repeat protein [Photobacterium leiognathi]|uniref:FG-GAP repeat protein n=1 Tax=Photobacterium leiognathi TaxID=553611 RepID=UPI00273A1EC3|nr:FG-GAP repeat protein [Photobacterium leiognathi]
MGTGSQHSITTSGAMQATYFKDDGGSWGRLSNAANYQIVIGVEGDGANTWNANGDKILIPALMNLTTDLSGFVVTSGDQGYGTIVTKGEFIAGAHTFELTVFHILGQNDKFVNSIYQLKNIGATNATNVRLWVGISDDRIEGDDTPNETRGNIVGGVFQAISSTSEASNTILEYGTAAEGTLILHSSDANVSSLINSYGSLITSIIPMNPSSSPINQINANGAFALYVRLADLNPNDNASFSVYSGGSEYAQIDSLTADISQDSATDWLSIIAAYAQDNTQPAPDYINYAKAGIWDVNPDNVAEVNAQVDSQTLTTVETIQPVVDSINAILNYSADSSASAPDASNYANVGITGVSTTNLVLLNGLVAGESVGLADIPALVTQADQLVVLRDYSADSSNTIPVLTNYTSGSLTDARSGNLNDYNLVLEGETLTTVVEFEALVQSVNALDDYADGTSTDEPTLTTYHQAGFTELVSVHVNLMNDLLVQNTLTSITGIQTAIDSLNVLMNHALDATATSPTLLDYSNINITDVNTNSLDYLNSHLDKEKSQGLSHFLKASDAGSPHQFGYSTAISRDGTTLAVFARKAPSDNTTSDDAGAVYVYRRDGQFWQETVVLRTNQTTNHAANFAMSGDGKRVVIVAPNQAYVFDVPVVNDLPDWNGDWSMTTIVHGYTESSPTTEINLFGDTLLFSGQSSTGKVKIYRQVNGVWTEKQEIFASTINTYFGATMSMSDDGKLIAIGAYDDSSQGRVYLYRNTGALWVLEETLVATGIDDDDRFGYSVSLNASGDRLAVGANRDDGPLNAINNQGAVYIFDYESSAWTETQVLRATEPAETDTFGVAVVLSPLGDQLMVAGYNKQAVYFYEITDPDVNAWQSTETYIESPSITNDIFGTLENISFNGKEAVVGANYDDSEFQGVVANSDHDTDFDSNDLTSTGTTFDNTARSLSNSGAAYVIAYQAYALDQSASLQARVDAINTILAYTADATDPTPTDTDYSLAGISGVDTNNVDTLNGYVGGQSVAVTDIQGLVTQVDHLLVLRAYSADATNTEPILDNFTGAGISTSRAVNLTDYNSELVNQTLTTEAEFQALVDAINALDDYADSTTTTAPSITTYHTAGFDELKDVNLAVMNAALLNNTLTTLADIQTALSALEALVNYALDDTSTAPTVDDYTNAGVTSVSSNILDYLNSHMNKEQREGFTHYLKASNAHASDSYGWSTAISDDGLTVAVFGRNAPTTSSATDDGGAIYIYRREGGTWQEVKILRTEQTTYHASNMVMSGDGKRVVMNVPTMAYVFDVAMVAGEPDWGGSWTMTSINHGMSNYYISGEISANGSVLVFAQVNNPTGYYTGRVRIYQFINGSWDYQTQFTGASSGSYFGYSSAVSSNGEVIAVGAMKQGNTGYVYVYRYNGTNWALEQSFRHANYGTDDYLGVGVSINAAGDRIAVGARQEDGATNSITNQGAVFVFDYDGSSWSETQVLRASDAAAGDGFGFQTQLSADGRKLVVSSLDVDTVYSYDLTNDDTTQWQASETIFSSPLSTTDEFGTYGIDFNGKDIVVGAHSDDYNYNGILTNSDNNTLFDANDTSSTGSAFDNTDIVTAANSGGAYVIANEPYALSTLDSLQARVDASNAILAWAAGGSTSPTVQQYKDAGIESVTASNLADMNSQIQSLAHTDMVNVQPMVDAVNTVLAYTTDATNTEPTLTDYQLAGITDAASGNLTLLNTDVADGTHSLTTIDTIATQAVQLAILRDYSADNTNTFPNLDNFTNAGLTAALSVNLNDYNRELDNQTLSTRAEFEALVSAINILDAYATDQTNPVPTYDTYVTAGFDELNSTELDWVNEILSTDNTLLSLDAIQNVIGAVNRLTDYSLGVRHHCADNE